MSGLATRLYLEKMARVRSYRGFSEQYEPTKSELRRILAEAAQNTANGGSRSQKGVKCSSIPFKTHAAQRKT